MTKIEIIKLVKKIKFNPTQILETGEMQVSKKEREMFTENKFKEIANIISTKIVHPLTIRPFPVDIISTAMKTINYKVKINDDTKKQAMECIKILLRKYKIKRAQMLIRITADAQYKDELMALMVIWSEKPKCLDTITEEGNITIEGVIEPKRFREITTTMEQDFKNIAALEVVEQSIMNKTVNSKFLNFRSVNWTTRTSWSR